MSQLKNIKINTPTYREIIPSNKTEVNITPFKVGDEKVLLLASESKDVNQMVDGLKSVISNCVDNIQVNDLASFDVEYLFLKIRAVSVGETADIMMTCSECETANEVKVDLTKIELRGLEEFKTNIKITDDLMFKMKTPNIDSFSKAENNPDSIINFIAGNVEKVFYGEETIDVGPNEIPDVEDIINQLTSVQFSDLQNYVLKIPKVSYDTEYTCKHCSTVNTNTLEGLSDFF